MSAAKTLSSAPIDVTMDVDIDTIDDEDVLKQMVRLFWFDFYSGILIDLNSSGK